MIPDTHHRREESFSIAQETSDRTNHNLNLPTCSPGKEKYGRRTPNMSNSKCGCSHRYEILN